ncbi:hypothetical protein AUK22_05610 [bacterium CG2_30_54_10]|nr:MAG: hypothetical protein AUK22_05610 [bacterium CG2_30_54_10]
MINNAVISTEGRSLLRQESLSFPELLSRYNARISSIILGNRESEAEGAQRPTAGSETREFTSRVERGRVPPLFEKLPMHFSSAEKFPCAFA